MHNQQNCFYYPSMLVCRATQKQDGGSERDVWALLCTAEREFLGQLGHFHLGAGLVKSLALSLELLTVAQV